jgi:hypothetical protein
MATAAEINVFRKLVEKHREWPRVLCFGDSWMQYPPHPTDLHKQLRRLFKHTAFLNESRPGRESAEIKALMPRLRALLGDFQFDVLVVSMGGNDVVGNELAEYVKTADEPQTPAAVAWGVVPPEVRDHIRLSSFDLALRYLVDDYRRVIGARDEAAPACEIVAHNYDYVWPDGRAFKLAGVKAGPWIKPQLDAVGLVGIERQRVVSSWLIDQFTRVMQALVSQTPRMRLVDARGTLTRNQWANEIHPTEGGFRRLAEQAWRPVLGGLLA